jgi:hypothetical protein
VPGKSASDREARQLECYMPNNEIHPTNRSVRRVDVPDHGLHYYVLPDDPLAALNVLRQAAGLDPFQEGSDSGETQ